MKIEFYTDLLLWFEDNDGESHDVWISQVAEKDEEHAYIVECEYIDYDNETLEGYLRINDYDYFFNLDGIYDEDEEVDEDNIYKVVSK
jgi:hypothetical protein